MAPLFQVYGVKMTRRIFLGFFLIGGLLSFIKKRFVKRQDLKEALFWKRLG